MQIQKIRIISNNICFGPCPLPEDEVEQHLTISTNGRVWFSGYNYDGGFGEYQISRKQQFSIGKEKAVAILDLVLQYFSCDPLIMCATDNGNWELTITEVDANEHWFKGSLCGNLVVDETDLTKYIRENILAITNSSGLVSLLHGKDGGLAIPKPFERDIFLDAGKLLFGRITAKEMQGSWLKIEIKVYLHE